MSKKNTAKNNTSFQPGPETDIWFNDTSAYDIMAATTRHIPEIMDLWMGRTAISTSACSKLPYTSTFDLHCGFNPDIYNVIDRLSFESGALSFLEDQISRGLVLINKLFNPHKHLSFIDLQRPIIGTAIYADLDRASQNISLCELFAHNYFKYAGLKLFTEGATLLKEEFGVVSINWNADSRNLHALKMYKKYGAKLDGVDYVAMINRLSTVPGIEINILDSSTENDFPNGSWNVEVIELLDNNRFSRPVPFIMTINDDSYFDNIIKKYCQIDIAENEHANNTTLISALINFAYFIKSSTSSTLESSKDLTHIKVMQNFDLNYMPDILPFNIEIESLGLVRGQVYMHKDLD